jgi:HEAT repeat protein
MELARVLSNVRPDAVLSNLSAGPGAQGDGAPKEEVTAQVFEDTALRWALRRLAATPEGEEAVIVEEQIFRVLMRSLQATHAASHLAQKLAEYAREYALPKHTFERLQQEVRWLTLTPQGRVRELLGVEHFNASEFRRLLDLIKELIRIGNVEQAGALGAQYFSIFEDHLSIRNEEVGRIPELLRSLSGVQGEFWTMAAYRLSEALTSAKLNQLIHVQVVNSLVALARIAATYEDFALVRTVGHALESSAARDAAAHALCCNNALRLLLQPSSVDRIVEIFLEKKNDSDWIKAVTGLLRWTDPNTLERIFRRLDIEPLAANRLALIRLLGRVGPGGLSPARQRLQHQEWYVIRNACKLLGDLKDPDLLEQLTPVFVHKDERVQKAAFQAIKESRLPKRKTAIAKVLPQLSPMLLEDALGELVFQPDPEVLCALEEYFSSPATSSIWAMVRVVRVMAAIPQAPAAEALARISLNEKLDESVRRAAQDALVTRSSFQNGALVPNQSSRSEEAPPCTGQQLDVSA